MDRERERAFPLGALTHQIIACFFEVFRELGHGFSEIVYQRALRHLLERGFDVAVEARILISSTDRYRNVRGNSSSMAV
jgi:GxxExxY protein